MNIGKLLLLSGGGFFLYQYLQGSGALSNLTGSAAPAPDNSAATAAAAVATENATADALAAVQAQIAKDAIVKNTVATVNEDLLGEAAVDKNAVGKAGNAKLKWDQWNWYQQKYAAKTGMVAPAGYAIEDVGLADRTTLLTATEYHGLKTAKGLSGIYSHRRNAWPVREVTSYYAVR